MTDASSRTTDDSVVTEVRLNFGSVEVERFPATGIVELVLRSPTGRWGWKTQLLPEQVIELKAALDG